MAMEQARQQLAEDGYVVIPHVVPAPLCQAVIEAISSFAGEDIERHPERFAGLGIVPVHHHQALWDVRQYPGLYEVFRDLYGREDLWVTMDRAGYKPPHESGRQHPVHWDCDPWTFEGFSVQALVYLTDTTEEQGAFACVPSVFRSIRAWCAAHEHDENRRHPAIGEHPLVRLAGPAGSLVVFHRLMPHTNTVNTSSRPRFAQYVTMHPPGDEAERAQRVHDWQEKMPPAWALRQKVAGQQIPEPGKPAVLTSLGRKLTGIDPW